MPALGASGTGEPGEGGHEASGADCQSRGLMLVFADLSVRIGSFKALIEHLSARKFLRLQRFKNAFSMMDKWGRTTKSILLRVETGDLTRSFG